MMYRECLLSCSVLSSDAALSVQSPRVGSGMILKTFLFGH